MKIHVFAVGNKMPKWVQLAWDDYAKRFPRDFSVTLHEIRPEPRSARKTAAQLMQLEGKRIDAALDPRDHLIVLDEHGSDIDTMEAARQLTQWQDMGKDISFLIGGPDGLDSTIKQKSSTQWRLSSLTLPHPFVRVLLIEQLYRAWSIMNNHPYHRS